MSYRVIAKLRHRKLSATLMAPRFTQLVGLTRARGQWRIRRRRISISRLSDRRRGGGPGLLNWLASRAREGGGGFGGGGFLFRDYQIDDGSDPRRGEVGGRCQSHPGSIDGGVEPPVNSIGWPHARARAVVDSAAADFYFAIIRSATGRTYGVVR